MNTAKIAALYNAGFYPHYLSVTPERQAEQLRMMRGLAYMDDTHPLLGDANQPDTWRYNLSTNDTNSISGPRRLDFLGQRTYCRAETYCPRRVYEWALGQLPTADDLDAADRCMATVAAHAPSDGEEKSIYSMRICGAGDFATLERGILAYQRKRQKYVKKLMAQLEAYHQQREELRRLKAGHWLGAEKALTTAARVDEPGLPFMGDADLTPEQRQQLVYWAVPEDAEMGSGFPAGTGLAMKRVKRSRELVDGAVYVYVYNWGEGTTPSVVMGRLHLAARTHGVLPLFRDEAPECQMLTYAAWQNENMKLYRVTHYTTRSAAPVPVMQAATQPLAKRPARRKQRRELALAA